MRLALPILAILFALFLISSISLKIGDKLLEGDKYSKAILAYTISHLANPFSKISLNRLLEAQVVKKERTEESEETSEKPPVYVNESGKVQGASAVVPVLMYHYIRHNPNPNDKVGFNLSVTPESFASQMDYLVSHGYHTISLDELGAVLLNHAGLPDKPVVITLDDGYRDSYTAAYPVLKSRGLKAVNFIITGFVGGPLYLTWDQIKEMSRNFTFSFGSHTVTHRSLPSISGKRLQSELKDSKEELMKRLGVPINWIAYPYGDVNTFVSSTTRQAGYTGAFGTNFGTFQSSDVMFTLPRVRIGGGDSVASFAQKLPWH